MKYFVTVKLVKLQDLWIRKFLDIYLTWTLCTVSSSAHSNNLKTRRKKNKIPQVGSSEKTDLTPQKSYAQQNLLGCVSYTLLDCVLWHVKLHVGQNSRFPWESVIGRLCVVSAWLLLVTEKSYKHIWMNSGVGELENQNSQLDFDGDRDPDRDFFKDVLS